MTTTGTGIPRIISVDDHVIEPPDLWRRYLPSARRDAGPRVERIKGRVGRTRRHFVFVPDDEGYWADCWIYDDRVMPITSGFAAVCFDREDVDNRAVTFDDLLPGCSQVEARLGDLDRNHTEASLCFPTFPRFCGQTFLEAADKDLALACVRAYNDWMIEEWCGGPAHGRLIPLTLVPMWDAGLAAAEVRRCAAKGSHAMCFSEAPAALGLPSIYSGEWDPLWQACEETDTVVNMHIGSSSTFPMTSKDAPTLVTIALTFEGSAHAAVDWLCSGVLERFGDLRIALSEGQVGWMPYLLERLDNAWDHARAYGGVRDQVPRPPSTYVPGRIFGCIYDDLAGLAMRDTVGMDQIMFETDYPHGDSTWPDSRRVVERIVEKAGLRPDEVRKLVRGNAIACYRLDRYGITA
jgi:predicted TIM-barrel fold metal-dependent hydrolase